MLRVVSVNLSICEMLRWPCVVSPSKAVTGKVRILLQVLILSSLVSYRSPPVRSSSTTHSLRVHSGANTCEVL